MDKVKVALIQMGMVSDHKKNLGKALEMIGEAAKKGANIVCLPELFSGLYFCQKEHDDGAFNEAETIPGPTTQVLSEVAKKNGIVLVGGSIFEKASEKFYNTAMVFGPDGKLLGTYRKTHIPHDPDFFEQNYFSAGDTGIKVFETPFGKICVLICYDQWFPEAARIATLHGAELIVYPTAIGTGDDISPVDPNIPEDWEEMWRSAQVGHAAVNNVYVAALNRVGTEGKMHFWGGSFIANPGGKILAKADDSEQILIADCDFSYVKKMQDSWRFLKERRPDMYGDITK